VPSLDKMTEDIDDIRKQMSQLKRTMRQFIDSYHKSTATMLDKLAVLELLLPQGDENDKAA